MPSLEALLESIAARLHEAFPALKACEVHDGRFDLPELRRIATRTPAMFTACLGVDQVANPGTEQADATLLLAIYIVTANAAGLSRGAAARALSEAVLQLVQGERWGGGTGEAAELRAENLYSGDIDKTGVALWGISWQQVLRIGTSVWDTTGVFPVHLYLGIVPDVGPAHVDDYVEVAALPGVDP